MVVLLMIGEALILKRECDNIVKGSDIIFQIRNIVLHIFDKHFIQTKVIFMSYFITKSNEWFLHFENVIIENNQINDHKPIFIYSEYKQKPE